MDQASPLNDFSSCSSSGVSDDSALCVPEPIFHSLSGYTLRVGRADRDMMNHLAANIETGSGDLLCHARRVLMAIDLKDSEAVFGALVDLFIAKGTGAYDVRSNLLRKAAPLLSSAQHDFLFERLGTGILAETPLCAPQSRLTTGFLGMTFTPLAAPAND